MVPSKNQNLTIFVLIAVFILILWGLASFIYFNSSSNGSPFLGCIGPNQFISMFPFIILPILWFAVTFWVFRDAEKRKMNGLLWGLLVFIGSFIGLLIYLIIRTESSDRLNGELKTVHCPSCQKSVEHTFTFCPDCGSQLKNVCKKCNQEVQTDWKVCPHCGAKL